MPDEEVKKSFADDLLHVASRVGEGVVDGLAETRPLIGRPLQYGLNAAGFNTEGYQDRQDQRAARKEALLAARKRNEEWDANAPLREKQRRAEEIKADEYAADAPLREAQRNEQLELLDAKRKNMHVAQFNDLLDKELAGNPQFQGLNFSERQDYIRSPEVQAMMEAKYYTGEIMGIAKNDKDAFDRMDRLLRQKGWSLVDGEDGIKYLDMGKLGRIPATKEAIDAINQKAAQGALEELNARANLSTAACLGDPGKAAISRYVKAVMPYNQGSAAISTRMIKSVYDSATEQEKGYHLFNQAFIDYRNPNLPMDARLAGLAKCQPFLQKMGFSMEGLDPKNPDIDKLTFIDLRGQEPVRLTTAQFENLLKQNDTLGMRLETRVAQVRDSYRQQAGIQLRNEIRDAANNLKSGAGKKKQENKPGETDPDQQRYNEELAAAFGNQYRKLPDGKRSKLQGIYREYESDRNLVLKRYNVQNVNDLPDEGLQELNDSWNIMVEQAGIPSKTYHSPVKNVIRDRSKKKLSSEIAIAEQQVKDQQTMNDDWDDNYHGDEDRGAGFRRMMALKKKQDRVDKLKRKKIE